MRRRSYNVETPSLVGAAVAVMLATLASARGDDAPVVDPGLTVFREQVEPLLRERCYECHSHAAGEAGGGLMLDSRAGWQAGGDSGPAIEPGKPDASVLLSAVRHDGTASDMPPDGRLSDDEIAAIAEWVRLGAADPRGGGFVERKGIDLQAGREFWSYRPVEEVVPPAVADEAWSANPIDRFVLARLEAAGFAPAADADRATLARRLYFDLTGLPPTPEQVDAFVADARPDAYERLVDRLLASPRFGERWGRHWLDVARFAESVTLRGFVFPEAWRYRDYVIESFDRDAAFDRFVREQIAGDLLPAGSDADRSRQLTATTYLALGNTNLEEQDKAQLRMDVVDEQLDAISKGLLAQTVTCARCHDHKFDPIPTADYYALAGILRNVKSLANANVSKWIEVPLPAAPEVEAAVRDHEAAVADLETRIKAAKKKAGPAVEGAPGPNAALAVQDVPGVAVDDADAAKLGEWRDSTFTRGFVGAGYVHDLNVGKGDKSITFDPDLPAAGEYEVWLAYSPGPSRSEAAPVTVFSADGEKTIPVDMRAAPPLGGRFVSLGRHRFETGGQSAVVVSNEGTKGYVTADAVAFVPAAEVAAAAAKLAGPADMAAGPPAVADLAGLEADLKKLKSSAPSRPMTMSVVEQEQIEDARIHVRGSVHNLGAVAPRGFLSVATTGPPVPMPADASGRAELAEWITSPENPLTARVYANRAWHWLFGAGLVPTPDNFGTTGEPPSHPELLDFLAARFVEDGWSVKRLVRRIVLSRTYRQSAVGEPAAVAGDPENRLFGRANRKRLDVECLRDAMLTAAGTLTETRGGPTFPAKLSADYGFESDAPLRSVYLPVFRNALPEPFEAFDFADPSTTTGRRNSGTIPQQALFLVNNEFSVEQSRAAAGRLLSDGTLRDARLAAAFRRTLGRLPTPGETRTVSAFLAGRSASSETERTAWGLVFQTLFATPEFRYSE